ncbi:hypothetical protein L6452_34254 [Arctium lappa]|uniref:Uncharacterized protein n=1 Tax=Arctium lappa TaxID=4217 RepID=A0ACB8YIP8_ARCLA|nr:hypothetical protein L6452_34254 [Arctium lappa]
MDSWSFSSVGKDESLSTSDAFGEDQIGSIGWEVKPPFIFGNNNNMGLFPNEINLQNQVFGDMGFPPLMRNSLFNPVMNAFSEENDSSSMLESNSRESGLFDLKLGRLIDPKEVQIFNPSKISHNLSSSEVVSTPSKRSREGGFGSSIPFCKVYGCNKNLSNCKDYHRRHKVCEAHSKTSKVIVNGIEQRFCQQCSRFHLLREFDDGKRSCRKRLAGHNERRRKPHAGGALSERYGRLLPSYDIGVKGNESKRSTRAISSFHIPDHLRSPYHQKHETNVSWQNNLEEKMAQDLQSISCVTDEQLHSKSFSPYDFETNPRFDGIVNAPMGLASSSECALSLLSSDQSRSSCCNSSRILTSTNMFPGVHYQDSGPLDERDMNPMVGFEGGVVEFGSKDMNSCDDLVLPDEGCTVDLLQLSSQLQRVDDHQKRRSQMKLANGVSVGLGIT